MQLIMRALALLFFAGGIFILVVDPPNWAIAVLSIAVFGAGAVIFMRMLALRRRAGG